jgi:hypothetical protein
MVMDIELAESEIRSLHVVIEEWLGGGCEKSPASFVRFSDALAEDFVIVSPSGQRSTKQTLCPGFEAAHGAEGQSFEIEIKNIDLRAATGEHLIATYEEHQQGRGGATARFSTVVFRPSSLPGRTLEWFHLHETWLTV